MINHLELFSGIGGFRQALSLLERDFGIFQRTVGFSEIDENAIKTYKAFFDVSDEIEMGDIVSFNQDLRNFLRLPRVDFLTGGFPCQAFSMMGKQRGFEDIRGNVFFQIVEILKYIHPKYVLLENVRNLRTHNRGDTFRTILKSIQDCGYNVYHDVFNTEDFGLAQRRNRVFIFATTENIENFDFSSKKVKSFFDKNRKKMSLLFQASTHGVLEKDVPEKYYLSCTIKPTILSNGTKAYQSKSEINPMVAKPLTATMVKMHRACQDNYFSDGFIQSEMPWEYLQTRFSKEELCRQRIRKITPKEAFLFQGFHPTLFEKACRVGVSDAQLYKQAGNAVSVNPVYAIMCYLFVKFRLR